jgi:protocatechuate 3,4-dioxygenase beta subunit
MTLDHLDEPDNGAVSAVLLSRRRLLTLGGVGAAGLLAVGGKSALAESSAAPARVSTAESSSACQLSSEQIEGPYYVDGALLRRDVVEDRTGIPLALNLRLIDSRTCKPIRNAAVEIWHCDALGVYSGYTAQGSGGGSGGPIPSGMPTPTDLPTGPPPGGGGGGGHATPTDDLTYLRGMQITDRHGRVTFTSIVPGWYAGRAVHIHTKVHTEGTATATGYIGGHTCHTGQFYFAENLITRLNQYAPYNTNTTTRVTLDQDSIYPGTGSLGGLLTTNFHKHHLNQGVISGLTMSVDPTATGDGGNTGAPRPTPTATATPTAT